MHEAVGLQDAAIRAYQRAVANNDPDGIAVHKLVGRGACVLATWRVMCIRGGEGPDGSWWVTTTRTYGAVRCVSCLALVSSRWECVVRAWQRLVGKNPRT